MSVQMEVTGEEMGQWLEKGDQKAKYSEWSESHNSFLLF